MFVVLDEAVEQRLFELGRAENSTDAPLIELDARLRADEELVVVSLPGQSQASPYSAAGEAIRCYGVRLHPGTHPAYPSAPLLPGEAPVLGVGDQAASPSMEAYLFSPDSEAPQSCEIEVVRLETDIFSRLKGIFDTRVLASKTVAVLGLGSGGSVGAVELAKSGVGGFILADYDRLRAHNISRHVCGLADVGRFKTRAVRDLIVQHNPQASVSTHEVDLAEDNDLLSQIVSDSDLVFVATDTELS